MSTMPKFNFKSTMSDADLNALDTRPKGKGQFEPGRYDLQIIDAQININKDQKNPGRSDNDPTWISVVLTLGGINDKTIRHYLLVPTVNEKYNKPGSKNPLAVYQMFKKFLRGVGLPFEQKDIPKTLNDYFADVSALVGRNVTVEVGYEGDHLKFNTLDKTFSVVNRDESKELIPGSFPDRDSAIAAAAEYGVDVKRSFTKVREFIARPVESINTESDGW